MFKKYISKHSKICSKNLISNSETPTYISLVLTKEKCIILESFKNHSRLRQKSMILIKKKVCTLFNLTETE